MSDQIEQRRDELENQRKVLSTQRVALSDQLRAIEEELRSLSNRDFRQEVLQEFPGIPESNWVFSGATTAYLDCEEGIIQVEHTGALYWVATCGVQGSGQSFHEAFGECAEKLQRESERVQDRSYKLGVIMSKMRTPEQ